MAGSSKIINEGRDFLHVLLQDDSVATDNGVWLDTGGFAEASIEINGITTATVVVRGSNAESKPAASTHRVSLSSQTADTIVALTQLPRWLKVQISVWTAGTVVVTAKLMKRT